MPARRGTPVCVSSSPAIPWSDTIRAASSPVNCAPQSDEALQSPYEDELSHLVNFHH